MPTAVFDQLAGQLPLKRWFRQGVLMAVSGGADSTALLHFLARCRRSLDLSTFAPLAVAHVNHRLRGDESDGDAVFVRKLAERYELNCFEYIVSPDDWLKDKSGSREAAAREIRYGFLVKTAEQVGMRHVVTAHTADDQAETVLHRIVRGTGLAGLAGIRPFRRASEAVTLLRPFLGIRRNEILDYLHALDEPYRSDSTNAGNAFTRNKIRNLVIPSIGRELGLDVGQSLCRLAKLASDTESVLDELVDEAMAQVLISDKDEEIVLDESKLKRYRPETIREIFVRIWKRRNWPLREMSFGHWNDLLDFFLNGNGARRCCGGIFATKTKDRLTFRRDAANSAASE